MSCIFCEDWKKFPTFCKFIVKVGIVAAAALAIFYLGKEVGQLIFHIVN